MTRKPSFADSMLVEVSGAPLSWTKHDCRIDGDKIAHLHKPTWGKLGEEFVWYCQRCGKRLEQPLGA